MDAKQFELPDATVTFTIPGKGELKTSLIQWAEGVAAFQTKQPSSNDSDKWDAWWKEVLSWVKQTYGVDLNPYYYGLVDATVSKGLEVLRENFTKGIGQAFGTDATLGS